MLPISNGQLPQTLTLGLLACYAIHRTLASSTASVFLARVGREVVGVSLGSVSVAGQLHPSLRPCRVCFRPDHHKLIAMSKCMSVDCRDELVEILSASSVLVLRL